MVVKKCGGSFESGEEYILPFANDACRDVKKKTRALHETLNAPSSGGLLG